MRRQEALRRDAGDRLSCWIAAAAPAAFTAVASPDDLPAQARAESEHWCDEVFTKEANPHDAGAPIAVCRGALHLIRRDYHAAGLDLTVIEGRNFLLVRVSRESLDLLSIPASARRAAVVRAAERIFAAPPRFRFCKPLGEGALFCSDQRVDPLLLASWRARAEGGVRGGELWFACYKKPSQRTGFANAAQWFDDAGEPRAPKAR